MFSRDFFVVETRSVTPGGLSLTSWHEDYALRTLFGRASSKSWENRSGLGLYDAAGEKVALRSFVAFRDFAAAACLYESRVALFTGADPGPHWAAHRVFLWRSKGHGERAACRALDASGDPVVLRSSGYDLVLAQLRRGR